MPPLQALKTLVHELAYALLHDLNDERHSAELEAESTAFPVCHDLSLDTFSYSFVYLAGWTESLEQLITSGERASKAAERIVSAIRCKSSLEAKPHMRQEEVTKEVMAV